jgi:hypothetical protein
MGAATLGSGVSGSWYNPSVTGKLGEHNGTVTGISATTTTDGTSVEGGGLEKDYVYDEEEEGEVGESEGRWKR